MSEFLRDIAKTKEYVYYIPSCRHFTVEPEISGADRPQFFFPSTNRLWRVFRNDGGRVELISANSVGCLTLADEVGYRNSIEILQLISLAHINSKLVSSARAVGYKKESIRRLLTPMNRRYVESNWGIPYDDEYYKEDVKILKEIGLFPIWGEMWLASRGLSAKEQAWIYFGVNGFRGNGDVALNVLNGLNVFVKHMMSTCTRDVYTILKLKSNVKIKTGRGTREDPYKI